jgi:hypothetical protein
MAAAVLLMGALQAAGLLRSGALAAAAAVAVELGLLPAAIPLAVPRGPETLLVATACAFDAVMLLLVVLLLAVARARFFRWRPRPRTAAALAVSAAAFAAVLAVLPHQGRLQLVLAVSLAFAVYAASVVGLGVLSSGDLATLRSGLALRRPAALRT